MENEMSFDLAVYGLLRKYPLYDFRIRPEKDTVCPSCSSAAA